ncbi:MAG: bile acid:sodium symporter family protein [Candidatus Pacearchaeota archaeon]
MPFADSLLQASMVLIMITIGLSISSREFKEVFEKPRSLIVGLASQIILLPVLAFIILQFFDLPVGVKMGILILSISPGGTTSNLISYLTNARTSLSVSMTGINTAIIMFSIPFFLNLFLGHYYGGGLKSQFDYLAVLSELVFVIAIPVLVGLLIKSKAPKFASRSEKWFRRTGLVFLAIVFVVKVFAPSSQGGSSLTTEGALIILPALIVFHVAALFMGLGNAKLFGVEKKSAMTIGIEVGLQNTALALLVASSVLESDIMSQPALVYAIFSFFTTAAFALGIKKWFLKEKLSLKV